MKRFGNFALGAFLGGLIGSSLALLFAPTKGESTRQAIADYFSNIIDEINQAADDKRAELQNQLDTLRSGN